MSIPESDAALADTLFQQFVQMYLHDEVSQDEAEQAAREVMELADVLCEKHDGYGTTPDPDWLFRAAEHDAGLATYLVEAGDDGVTDEDIRFWHGLPYLERAAYQAECELDFLQSTLAACMEPNSDGVFRSVPFWRCAAEPPEPEVDVRPLPLELYPRYINWCADREEAGDDFGALVAPHGTMNALIRAEARAGRL